MATRVNALLKKYEKDKYIMVFEHKYLENLMSNKFSILDDIRKLIRVFIYLLLLSIGVSSFGTSTSNVEENSFSALGIMSGKVEIRL